MSSTSEITVETEIAKFSSERFLLYKKYQTTVHGDDPDEVTEQSFTRFLVQTSLVHGGASCGNIPCGTYHQLYRLDGELIAVGVLDFLPSGVSSVYLFYDPDRKDFALGKYSALKEIEFCQELGVEFYYMGFYIHTCPKMKYKGEYAPSELLCPTTREWHRLEECVPLLDRHRFTPFRDDLAAARDAIARSCRDSTEIDNSIAAVSTEEAELLLQFAPTFTGQQTNVAEVLLDLNHPNRFFSITDITEEGQKILTPILESWVALCGQDVAPLLIVKLCS